MFQWCGYIVTLSFTPCLPLIFPRADEEKMEREQKYKIWIPSDIYTHRKRGFTMYIDSQTQLRARLNAAPKTNMEVIENGNSKPEITVKKYGFPNQYCPQKTDFR